MTLYFFVGRGVAPAQKWAKERQVEEVMQRVEERAASSVFLFAVQSGGRWVVWSVKSVHWCAALGRGPESSPERWMTGCVGWISNGKIPN